MENVDNHMRSEYWEEKTHHITFSSPEQMETLFNFQIMIMTQHSWTEQKLFF